MGKNELIREIVKCLSGGQVLRNVEKPKIGVLLINTGTPDGYTFFPMWRYLRQFLSDSRIVEAPKILWYPLLYFVILTTRPFKKGISYKRIWNADKNELPLREISRSQASGLQDRILQNPEKINIEVEYAFRYGNPSVEEKIKKLENQGCDKLVVFPLFPQYSGTTVGSCSDQVFLNLLKQRKQMAVHTVQNYYKNEVFLKAISTNIKNKIEEFRKIKFEAVVLSYHGIPLAYSKQGDPYGEQCFETTKLIKDYCNLEGLEFVTTFQSKLGPSEWLKPYTDELVTELAKEGIKNLLIITPGFSSDCLETLEELEMDLAEDFRKHGGENLIYVPCLNASEAGIDVIEDVLRKEIQSFLSM